MRGIPGIGIVWLAAVLGGCGEAGPRPNVLLISIDSLRADHLGCYGYERDSSPAIDRLAAQGTLFETVTSSTSWTLPAHASMFTALPDSVHGCDRNASVLAPERLTLAEVLSDDGYRTAAFWSGPYLHPRFGLSQGFQEYESCASSDFYKPEELADRGALREVQKRVNDLSHEDVTSPRLLERVSEWLRSNRERPFFVFVHMWDVHYDYIPPAPYSTMFTDPDYAGSVDGRGLGGSGKLQRQGLPPADLAQLVALYDGEIAWTDHHVGAILDLLDELALSDDTIVILTSDHGEEFFEHDRFGHKIALFEESIRIPLIVRYPPAVPAGRRVTQIAGMVDLAPTVLELAGLDPLPDVMGRSLVPALNGGRREADPWVLSELVKVRKKQNLLALRTEDWKWIVERRGGAHVALYDLRSDPGERTDVVDTDPELRERARSAGEQAVRQLERLAELHPAKSTVSTQAMSPELERQLRGLGYLGDDVE